MMILSKAKMAVVVVAADFSGERVRSLRHPRRKRTLVSDSGRPFYDFIIVG